MDTKEYNSRVAAFNTKYPNGGVRGRRMPSADRNEAIVLWNSGIKLGSSSKECAIDLGLHNGTIRKWENEFKSNAGITTKTSKRKAKRSSAARSYAAVVPNPAPSSLSLTLPNGANISGLTLDQLKELIRD